ncbi:MAG TPA: cytochrome c biogenesis protein CcsA [Thermoanaerobaculia bacterium]|nr:cytochrome c biogenesis protein CcsA [Thermoanaerobaculia bacterium]
MKNLLAALLWLWMCLVLVGAFFYAPAAAGFIGYSSRILFFHVPLAWTAFVAFLVAAVWSGLYLVRGRPGDDRAAAAAVELGFVYCLLATLTGAMWARTMWGAFWNWDPRQFSIVLVLLFYGAYLALRGAVDDRQLRARLAAVYALLGVVVTPFFFWVVPRMKRFFSLHPDSVVNTRGTIDMESHMLQVLLASWVGFNALFFWLHDLHRRAAALHEAEEA